MFPRRLLAALSALALLSSGSAARAAPANWPATIALSPIGGHVMGNPEAPTKVVEYVSYTCGHCAHFVAEASGPLKAGYVKTGAVSVEVRNAVRDRYDLTAALIARCGGRYRFFGNHEALFANQEAWIKQVQAYDAAHRTPAPNQTRAAIFQDIARKTGLYALMMKRGFNAKQLDICVADPLALNKITAMTEDAWNQAKIKGTPGFTVNGALVDGSDWATLRAALPTPSN